MSGRAPLPEWYDDLSGSLQAAWGALTRGALDRRSGFHHASVATIGLDGRPRQRVMILRAVDPENRTLRFHTDIRSEKARDIEGEPRVSLLFYDANAKVQIRIEGQARLHHGDAVAEAAWLASLRMSRACYGIIPASGAMIEASDGYALPDPHDDAALDMGRAHFSALVVSALSLEWLYLTYEGHRRARFEWDGGGKSAAYWLAP